MGLFDIPAPLFTAIDGLLTNLPPLLRLLLWAAFTGVISMLCYWLCSSQGKVSAAKTAAISARRELAAYDGHEFSELWPLLGATLGNSAKHFWIVLGPALLGSVPALCVIVWVSNQFGYVQPSPGTQLDITAQPAAELLLTDGAGNTVDTWPAVGESAVVEDLDGVRLTRLPPPAAVPVVHKRRWWNTLIGNPAGYLPEATAIDEIRLPIDRQFFFAAGPDWIQTWEAPYFLVLILTSLLIKFVFKID